MITKTGTVGLPKAKKKIADGIQKHYEIDTIRYSTSYFIYKKSDQKAEYSEMRNKFKCYVDGKEFPINCFESDEAAIIEFNKALGIVGSKNVKGMKKKFDNDPNYKVRMRDNIGSIRISEVKAYAKQVKGIDDFLMPFDKVNFLRQKYPDLYKEIETISDPKLQRKAAGKIIDSNNLEGIFLAVSAKQRVITDEMMFKLACEQVNRSSAKLNYKKGRNNKQWYDYDCSMNCLFFPHYDKMFDTEDGEEGKIDYHLDTPEFDQKAKVMIDGLTHYEKFIKADREAAYEMEKKYKWLKQGEALGLDQADRLDELQNTAHREFKKILDEKDEATYEKFINAKSKDNIDDVEKSEFVKTIYQYTDRANFSTKQHQDIDDLIKGKSKLSNKKQRELINEMLKSSSANYLMNHKIQKMIDALKQSKKNNYAIRQELKAMGITIEEHFEYKNVYTFKKGVKNAGRSYSIINIEGVGRFDSRALPPQFTNQIDRYNEIKRIENKLYQNQSDRSSLHEYFTNAFLRMNMHKGKSIAEIQQLMNDNHGITFIPKTKNGEYLSSNFRFHNNQEGIEAKSSHFMTKKEMEEYLRNIVIEYFKAQNRQWNEEDLKKEMERQLLEAERNAEEYRNQYLRIFFKDIALEQQKNAALLFVVGNEYFSKNFSFDGQAYYRGDIKKVSITRNDENGMSLSLLDNRKDTLLLTSEIMLNRAIERFNQRGTQSIITATKQSDLEFMWIKAQLDPQLKDLVEFQLENGEPFAPSASAIAELNAEIQAKNNKVSGKLKNQKVYNNKFSFKQSNLYQWHLPELREPYIKHMAELLDQGVKVDYPDHYLIDDSEAILKAASQKSPSALVRAQEMIDKLSDSYDKAKAKYDEEQAEKRLDTRISNTENELAEDIDNLVNTGKTNSFLKNKNKELSNVKQRKLSEQPINNNNKSITNVMVRLEAVKAGSNGFTINQEGLTVWLKTLRDMHIDITEKQMFDLFKEIKESGAHLNNEINDRVFKNHIKKEEIKRTTRKVIHNIKYKNVKKLQNKPEK
ncbi:Uncharacterised protein [Vibrio cholerae]|nr:Uncharacterised protein [Vibrio cholerae]